jgi:hypothetical protein
LLKATSEQFEVGQDRFSFHLLVPNISWRRRGQYEAWVRFISLVVRALPSGSAKCQGLCILEAA